MLNYSVAELRNTTYNTLLDKRIYGILVKLKERMDQIIFILMLSI